MTEKPGCSEKGLRASIRAVREGDFRMSCQVKPRAPRSWKAGAGGEISRFLSFLREV